MASMNAILPKGSKLPYPSPIRTRALWSRQSFSYSSLTMGLSKTASPPVKGDDVMALAAPIALIGLELPADACLAIISRSTPAGGKGGGRLSAYAIMQSACHRIIFPIVSSDCPDLSRCAMVIFLYSRAWKSSVMPIRANSCSHSVCAASISSPIRRTCAGSTSLPVCIDSCMRASSVMKRGVIEESSDMPDASRPSSRQADDRNGQNGPIGVMQTTEARFSLMKMARRGGGKYRRRAVTEVKSSKWHSAFMELAQRSAARCDGR
mmetsp:Transcript_24448/g.60660  ORF Transcript_24448/g.60660 Transcript_24448/m.60660 type:complete len:265 (+) Transcript_24448:481-1275(+)